MSEDQHQDIITYSQPLIKEIRDTSTLKVFDDKNLLLVLKFLRTHDGVMTAKELENCFKQAKEPRSNKSIYRYLKKLEEKELVVHVGKRVFPQEKSKLSTQNLYMRSAKIFFPITQLQEQIKEIESPEYQILMKSVGVLLGQQMNGKLTSIECLHNFIIQIRDRQGEIFRQLVRDTEGELSKLLVELDWGKLEHLLSITSFLAILNDEIDWQAKLNSCFDQE